MTSDAAIFGIGKSLGRGTIISLLVTMFVLPQILMVGDRIIELTAFTMNMPVSTTKRTGSMRIDGIVRGRINGTVTGVMHAIVRGDIDAYVKNEVQAIEEKCDTKTAPPVENTEMNGGVDA